MKRLVVAISCVFACNAGSQEDADGGSESGTETGTTENAVDPAACEDAWPVADDQGRETGLVRCSNGRTHRETAVDCEGEPVVPEPAGMCENFQSQCRTHADCEADEYCHEPGEGYPCACATRRTCNADSDCGPGAACFCFFGGGRQCVTAGCLTDDDCPDALCAVANLPHDWCDWPPFQRLDCTTADDECVSTADCDTCEACVPEDGIWRCVDACEDHCGTP